MDYLAFKRVYHDDLLHYGIKRRSGRYPYGSGERPFQGEIKKIIDDTVRNKERKRWNKKIKTLNDHEIAYRMNYDIKNEGYQKSLNNLRTLSEQIDIDLDNVKDIAKQEIKDSMSSQDFKKDLDKYIRDHLKSKEPNYQELRDASRNVLNTSKYMPETSKKVLQLNRNIDRYYDSIIDETNRLLGDVGLTKIPKTKSSATYGDVLEKIFEYHTRRNWIESLLETREFTMEDYIDLDQFISEYRR